MLEKGLHVIRYIGTKRVEKLLPYCNQVYIQISCKGHCFKGWHSACFQVKRNLVSFNFCKNTFIKHLYKYTMLLIADIIFSSECNYLCILTRYFWKPCFSILQKSWYWTIFQDSVLPLSFCVDTLFGIRPCLVYSTIKNYCPD